MGRICSVVGCQNAVGLHRFPLDLKPRRHWLRVVGLGEDYELPPQAGVCKVHFTRESFTNIMEFELGFVKRLRMKRGAVPTLYLPQIHKKPRILLPRSRGYLKHQIELLKGTREIACQTDPVVSNDVHAQQTQAEAPNNLMEIPLPKSPRSESAPVKRKRCEVANFDLSFHLNDQVNAVKCGSTPTEIPPHKEKKYIVHEAQLLELFRRCPVCASHCTVDTVTVGTLLKVTQQCPRCHHYRQWSSQPMVKSIPAGNLQLCAAVLFTGSSFSQISKFLGAFNIQGLSEQCFSKHQAEILIPTVSWQWKLEQDDLIRKALEGGSVTLGGGVWTDSPAKCSSYTMMNLQSNKVIDIQLVQSKEVGNGVQMETKGFVRSLNFLEERGVKVQTIVTDRNKVMQKFLKEEKKKITHYFDPWRMGKGIGKRIDELSKRRNTRDVGLWRNGVVNHLHWSTLTSSSGQETVANWTSVANHLQNVHTHALLPCCLHKPLVEGTQRLKPDTSVYETLSAILLAPQFLKDVEKISPRYHTSSLEALHSLINKFFPKNVGISPKEVLTRLQIAALHFNENTTQSCTTTSAAELKYSILHPKNKGGNYTARALKTKPTSFYIDKLMALLFERVVPNAVPFREYSDKIPGLEPLCA